MTPPESLPPFPNGWPFDPPPGPVLGARGMVATTDLLASRVGLEVLRAGGNAVDAAVAASFALAVVNPEAGNVGGSGFMLVRTGDGDVAALDYRARAPAAATRDMFVGEVQAGRAPAEVEAGRAPASGRRERPSELGHLAVGVPGSVRGLREAHRRFGTVPWAELVAPAVELARGFLVTERFTASFQPHIVEGLARFPASARIFLPGGRPPEVGDTFRQPDLARTLERIRDRGDDGFYRGETARGIVAESERGGGVLTLEDLASYRAVWRRPLRIPYRGHLLISMPPSSSGGVALAAMAGMLEDRPPGRMPWHGPDHIHLLAETWRRVYADRNHYLADADYRDIPLEVLTSREYAAWRASDLEAGAATPSDRVGPGVEAYLAGGSPRDARPPEGNSPGGGAHTTHLSVVDSGGNSVSCTTTLNTWYGSKVVAEGTGVLLNNEMDDFTVRPGTPNHFGLVQGEANAVEGGKRPLSAMTPTLVLDGEARLRMVVGTPGGATILTTVFQVVSNVLDHGMSLAWAVAAPRIHHQHHPDRIQLEPGGLPGGVARALEAMGHRVAERDELSGDVQAVGVREDGSLEGVADPRRGGAALGY